MIRYNSAHRQCAELQRMVFASLRSVQSRRPLDVVHRHAESASPMGGVPASQMYWAVATRQARGSALNSNFWYLLCNKQGKLC